MPCSPKCWPWSAWRTKPTGSRADIKWRSTKNFWPTRRPRLELRSVFSDDGVAQLAEAFNADDNFIAWLQVARRFACKSDAARCSRGDHIARLQRYDARKVRHKIGNLEDQFPRIGMLQYLAAHAWSDNAEADIERMWIGDFIRACEVRPHGRERVERLAQHPLRRERLNIAGADIVEGGVSENMPLPIFGGDMPPARADHEREFCLVIRLARILRKHDGCARADHSV